jgi:hypothetical protein
MTSHQAEDDDLVFTVMMVVVVIWQASRVLKLPLFSSDTS